MTSAIVQLGAHRLISCAQPFQITQADEASGRCLSAALDFALAAKQGHGIDVRLVKWHVAGDPNYVEHWAVLLDPGRVIDLTRVQVDGKRQLVHAIADYPCNYLECRIYPASLLMRTYAESVAPDDTRLPDRFLWACGTSLFGFDMAAAWRQRDAARAVAALRECRTFLVCFLLGRATRALERRARLLLARLHARPDVAGRCNKPVLPDRRRGERRPASAL
jgi:hypothetical protein